MFAVALWRHECERVFCDKLINNQDKDTIINYIHEVSIEKFGHLENEIMEKVAKKEKPIFFCDFLREDTINEEGYIEEYAEKIYEAVNDPQKLKDRCNFLLDQYN